MAADRLVGTTISHYDVLERLGGGGMGVVYKARDLKLKRLVALKLLQPDLTRDEESKRRFIQEAQAASGLDHPNICTFYEIDETSEGQLFLVMALYDGHTLKERIAAGPLALEAAIDVALQSAQALHKAHAHGIVHRDIKPANLMVTADAVVKVLDFGVAKLLDQTGITGPGTALGTIAYMSPEQTRGEPVDARADLWALGVVLYEAIAGHLPFAGDAPVVVATAIQQREPKPLTSVRRDVPVTIERVVERALRKDPGERFQTAADFLAELRRLARELHPSGAATSSGASAAATAPATPSVVVLPFANTGGNPENEFFSDGMTEEIIGALMRVKTLHVVARTSAFAFKGKNLDVRAIGQQLGVSAVLEGSVRKAGTRLRISVQLVNVADGFRLWSDRYDREEQDIFAIQDEISKTIAETLTRQLAPAVERTPAAQPTHDLEAYTLYLKGRHHWNRRTHDGMHTAIRYFDQAIARDPDFALAHAGLADSYALLGWVAIGGLEPRGAFPRATASALRALELNPTLAEAHNSLGWTRLVYDWDWTGAERSFTRALECDPRYATAHSWYAMHLAWTGRMTEGLEHAARAQELDPLSLIIHTLAGWVLHFAGRYDEAIAQCQKALELDPGYVRAYLGLGWAYQHQGKLDLAQAEFERGAALSDRSPRYVAALGAIHALRGHAEPARACLAELDAIARRRYVTPTDRAVVHAALGEADQTFAQLQQAYHERSGALVYLRLDPDFSSVASDPRFADLIRKMNFPNTQ